jgi:hypothetical protein
MNLEIAKKYNILGYLEITSTNSSILRGDNTTVRISADVPIIDRTQNYDTLG